ncbi:aldolase [Photobacterium ganghwense]|uniref:Aldolase n=1 Tax=Photobacterium ganghwense TaxID=320778 RepID=A0A0J1H9M7_9GAMM|nr:aldolase/citrate lyase family protein [Photobacterium ganghwense]KLV08408.1 aldolase [Photobacterium ganghwense]PSU07545.1 aldolase [Photobacterium ganghwense]
MFNFKPSISEQVLLGTFVKTPHPHIIEVLAIAELPFIVLDAEHAPFDRASLDVCILAARAHQLPCLVRVPDSNPSTVLNALDCGATGVQIPHVCTAQQAEDIARMCHYGERGRGYAGSSRAACYTTKPMAKHLSDSKAKTVVIAQIEDPEGVENIERIAQVEGIDALFIGQVDLTVAYGASSVNDDRVTQASIRIIEAAKASHKPVGMFVATAEAAKQWAELGVQFFCVGSEHKMIIDGFKREINVMNS